MFEAFAQARLWLANLDPAAPAVALMLGVFLTIYSIRRWFPRVWLWVEKTVPLVDSLDYRPAAQILWNVWQAWPAAALGAIMSALSTGGSGWGALKGAALGAAVAAIHKLAAAYKGKAGDPKPPDGAGVLGAAFALALVVFALPLTACGVFAAATPLLAQAAVIISDAMNAISAAEALLPSLHLGADEQAKAEALIARLRKAASAAAKADAGATDLTAEQLDASLADFRAAWSDLQGVFAAHRALGAAPGVQTLPVPLALSRVQK